MNRNFLMGGLIIVLSAYYFFDFNNYFYNHLYILNSVSDLIESIVRGDIKSVSLINRVDDYRLLISFFQEADVHQLLLGDLSSLNPSGLPEVGLVSNILSYGVLGAIYFYAFLLYLFRSSDSKINVFAFSIIMLDIFVNITQSVFLLISLLMLVKYQPQIDRISRSKNVRKA